VITANAASVRLTVIEASEPGIETDVVGSVPLACHHRGMDGTRIDRWLWTVRLAKTRSLAAQACRAGHVQINGVRAKPSAPVNVGDTVRARLGGRERVVEVVRLPGSRVGPELAAACLVDRSPPPSRDPLAELTDRGAGRPTKRNRRLLDRARGRRT
jgi:ribosome-associated heat shock protein Hsp15